MAYFDHRLSCIASVLWLISTACTGSRSSDEQRPEPRGAPTTALAEDNGADDQDGAQRPQASATTPPSKEASAHPAEQKAERPSAEGKPIAQQQLTTAKAGPSVRRLVVASDVKEREPIELVQAHSKQPIVAFLELNNAAGADASVVITFEHENGKKVGFIELSVPGASPRYRTWGRTHHIDESGTWTAVVRTKAGDELARHAFSVTG